MKSNRSIFIGLLLACAACVLAELAAADSGVSPLPALTDDGDNDGNANCVDVRHAKDKCAFIRSTDECADDMGYFNYLEWYYCNTHESWSMILVFVILLIVVFSLLSTTAEDYFCPPLTHLADGLKLSPRFAGCTLLALGNGAPDIFSTFAAIGSDDPSQPLSSRSLQLSLGALSGAGLFVGGIVFSAVGLTSPDSIKASSPLLRDVCALLTACTFSFIVMSDGKLYIMEAVSFLVLYIVYVIVVLLWDRMRKKTSDTDGPLLATEAINQAADAESGQVQSATNDTSKSLTRKGSIMEPHALEHLMTGINLPADVRGSWTRLKEMVHEQWQSSNVFGKILYVMETPFTILRRITCPLGGEEEWNKGLAVASFFFLPLFVLVYLQAFDASVGHMPAWAMCVIVGAVAASVVYFTCSDESPRLPVLISFFGFASATLWMDMVANELVAIIKTLGVILDINQDIMGLTVMSWANSVGDLVADIKVAKQGYASMAATACFAGPMFNQLIGLGVGFLLHSSGEPSPYPVNLSGNNLLSFSFREAYFVAIAATVALFMKGERQLPRIMFFILIGGYVLFMILSILQQFGVINVHGIGSNV